MKSFVRHGLLAVALLAAAPVAFAQPAPNKQPSRVSQMQRFGGACVGCDLAGRALPELRIEGANFSGAKFHRAFLVRMTGDRSNFADADFSLANLTRASLVEARCQRARFSAAVMTGLDGSRAQFDNASFSNAELAEAQFVQARLQGASFAGAQAARTNFLRADLRNAQFDFARLQHADFTQADLSGATFVNANLSGANLSQARRLTAAQLRGACGDQSTQLPAGLRIAPCN